MKIPFPLVSVIINCYNSERFLKEAIDSVYSQTFTDWEIVFWDNASTDNSATIAKSYDEKLKYYKGEETVPLGAARNEALKKSRGRYIAFLDCDDIYIGNKLEKQILLMNKESYGLVYGGVIFIDELGENTKIRTVKKKSGMIFKKLLMHYDINMQTVMISREVLEAGCKFNPELSFSPDYDLFLEAAYQFNVGIIREPICKYRVHCNSLTNRSQELVAQEGRYTLNRLKEKYPEILKKYYFAFKYANATYDFQDAIFLLFKNDIFKAKQQIAKNILFHPKSMITYFLILIGIPSNQILKLIGRV